MNDKEIFMNISKNIFEVRGIVKQAIKCCFLTLFFLNINSIRVNAQFCGTQPSVNGDALLRKAEMEQDILDYVTLANGRIAASEFTIPVVVHIYGYNTTDLPDSKVQEQITILNNAFTANIHNSAIGTTIRFCLAKRDKFGYASTGIIRRTDLGGSYTINDDSWIKGQSNWPSQSYLNIWVVNLDVNEPLAWATFPFDKPVGSFLDGIVISKSVFANNNHPHNGGGKVLVHEVGHYLNLYHTWGDKDDCSGTDYCEDTPSCSGPVSGCPTSTNQCGGGLRLVSNHMDYTSDACRNNFTFNQATRMNAALTMHRSGLLDNIDACSDPVDPFCCTPPPKWHPGEWEGGVCSAYFSGTTLTNKDWGEFDNTVKSYKDYIIAVNNVIMRPNSHTIFRAGDWISLRPGTHIQNGAYFWGRIKSCSLGPFLFWQNIFREGVTEETADVMDLGSINIRPNPTAGLFQIQAKEIEAVELLNSFGERVKLLKVDFKDEANIDMSGFSSGIYYCKVITSGKIYIEKVSLTR
ncbi:MAG: M43 family zinc metalloprotease [Sporocytophaga sp.]|nr:M43 family zinc metalloprotease [Sporocytophaga sp.]